MQEHVLAVWPACWLMPPIGLNGRSMPCPCPPPPIHINSPHSPPFSFSSLFSPLNLHSTLTLTPPCIYYISYSHKPFNLLLSLFPNSISQFCIHTPPLGNRRFRPSSEFAQKPTRFQSSPIPPSSTHSTPLVFLASSSPHLVSSSPLILLSPLIGSRRIEECGYCALYDYSFH